MSKSLIDYAFDLVNSKNEAVSFADIWAYVVKEAELTEDEAAARVARFYTNLMLDGRFVTLGENLWDLRVRHTFDKVHIDMKDVYSNIDEDTDDNEDPEEKEDDGAEELAESNGDDADAEEKASEEEEL